MNIYKDFFEYGVLWAVLQIPVYIFLWDTVFYFGHRFILHTDLIFNWSHKHHHALLPPSPWSGISVDPFELLLSGMAPYLLPLLVLPFNLRTVEIINLVLMLQGQVMHSSCPYTYGGPLDWWLFSPVGHNLHHTHHDNKWPHNYGVIFKLWDRLLGTLSEKLPDWGESKDK